MADVHRTAKAPVVPTDGTFPYWATVCGKDLHAGVTITDDPKSVTCARCKAKKGKR